MGLWDEVKKLTKDPQAERIKAREQEKHGALLVVRQTNVEVRPKRLLIFEDRVEMHDPGFLKTEVKTVRYPQIAGVRIEGRVLRGDVIIESTGGDKISVPKLPRGEAQAARDLIQQKMAERDAPSPVASEAARSYVADQIRKLADLREAGILTEEEFESKKAELLKRL